MNEGKQHPTGVTVMDSKLTLGSASEGCVHEVTSLKPARWAVMERLPDQFQHVLFFVIFLLSFSSFLMLIITIVFLISHGVNIGCENVSYRFSSKSKLWLEYPVECLGA